MKRGLIGVLAIVMLLSTVGMTGSVAAQDGDIEDCRALENQVDAGIEISEGVITGTFNEDDDLDGVSSDIPQGQYIEFTFRPIDPDETGDTSINIFKSGEIEIRGIESGDGNSIVDVDGLQEVPGPTVSFEIWGQTDSEVCVELFDDNWETQSDWEVEIERSNPDVTLFDVRELEDELTDAQSEITDLESQVEEKNERINELESQLEERNQTITELESQLENADVTIDVSVEPAGQASFSAGGEMAVDVEAQGEPAADVTLGFAGEEYTPTGGDTTIPMEEAGTQQLTVEYEDTTETMTLDVEPGDEDPDTDNGDSTDTPSDDDSTETNPDDDPVESDPDDGTTGGDESGSDGSGPGFGVGGALAGLGGAGYLLKRRFGDEDSE